MKITKNINQANRDQFLQKGAAMVGMIGGVVAMGVIGASLVSLNRSSERSHLTANSGSRAHFLAESGLEFAQRANTFDEWLHGRKRTINLQGGDSVEVIRHGDVFWATAVVDEGTVKEGRAVMPAVVRENSGPEDPDNPGDPSNPTNPVVEDFVIFGDNGFNLSRPLKAEGHVGMALQDVNVYGDIDGNVLGKDILFNTASCTDGHVYAGDDFKITCGYLHGDVHATDDIEAIGQFSTVNGWLFANDRVVITDYAKVYGHVHSLNGSVTIGPHSVVGSPSNPVEVRAKGNVTLANCAVIYGTVYAGGDIIGADGIVGDAFAGGIVDRDSVLDTVSDVSGSLFTTVSNAVTYLEDPIAPDLSPLDSMKLPDATSFTAGSKNLELKEYTYYSVSPGAFGNFYTYGNASCHMRLRTGDNGDGNYYFNSLQFGQNMYLYLDLMGDDNINIFVKGNIDIGHCLKVFYRHDGHPDWKLLNGNPSDPEVAKRVYWESHCNFSMKPNCWMGTVYTPYGLLHADCPSYLAGSFYSGGGHCINGGRAEFQKSNYLSGK